MDTLSALLLVIHVTSIVLLAGPFYALMIVNQRALLGRGMFYWADKYFDVLVMIILGVQLARPLPPAGVAILIGLAALFTARAYRTTIRQGWF